MRLLCFLRLAHGGDPTSPADQLAHVQILKLGVRAGQHRAAPGASSGGLMGWDAGVLCPHPSPAGQWAPPTVA